MSSELREHLQQLIDENEVILFMKGTPDAPACGFSARSVGVLDSLGARYAAVDILPDPAIRAELSAISQWPTIPQLFVKGELVGGSDIITEMFESGELANVLGAKPAAAGSPDAGAVAAEPVPGDATIRLEDNLS